MPIAPPAEVLLAVENVSLSFGGVKAIRDVSFDIRKGEIRAIIGPNGAGKTSMLNVINGFYHPQEGRITFKGETRSKMRPYRGRARRHRAHLPERRAVQGHVDARQHHGGAHAEDASRPSSGRCSASARRATRRSSIARSVEEIIDFLRDPAHPQDRRSASCPTACRSGSSSAARSRWSRICCCSTSRWPA